MTAGAKTPMSDVPQTTESASAEGPMIRFDELTKRFRGSTQPAVDRVSMDIRRGETVVLVGPSGCGKTTTTELINRLIEPTSGRIVLDGEDATRADPDALRRRIGYVIQETGLFPHQTIAANIATVPRMLGWKKPRIDELVGMNAATYRGRYPKELSGGQRQRVGVARAMAADPPVMLMDEPFGAIDPITRERLQNEFLRVQQQIQKTIVFVTHDVDEAIKMGDRIAVLREQSHIAQFDTPEEILTNPADSYVEDFIGAGASLKRLNLTRIRDVEMTLDCPTAQLSDSVEEVRRRLYESDWWTVLLLDEQRRPRRCVNARDLNRPQAELTRVGLPVVALVEPQETLSDALNELITSNAGVAVVVDGPGVYQGLVDQDTLMTSVRSTRDRSREYYRAAKVAADEVIR
jgi:osmoprotectant transport system ATP-binding protein